MAIATRRCSRPVAGSSCAIVSPDVVVVRRHVKRSVFFDRIRLLAAPHARVDLLEVDGEGPSELVHVSWSDLSQRRVPELVRSVAEASPADVRERVRARRRSCDEKSRRKPCDDERRR